MKLYAAALTCKQFATFARPIRVMTILAASPDEALGRAILRARDIWRGDHYTEHSCADIAEIPDETIDAYLKVKP